MSTRALGTSERTEAASAPVDAEAPVARSEAPAAGDTPAVVRWLRHLDVVLLVLALPVFLAGGLSMTGYAVGGGAWLLQKGIAMAAQHKADRSRDPRTVVGLLMGGAILRGWLCAGAVLTAGLAADDRTGLAATLLVLALFTVYISTKFLEKGMSALAPTGAGAESGSTRATGSPTPGASA